MNVSIKIKLTAVIAMRAAFTSLDNWFTISYHWSAFFWSTSFTATNAKTNFTRIRLIGWQFVSFWIECGINQTA